MASVTLIPTVKAYPALSHKYGEAVCVAGIRIDTPTPEWVRLFPLRFRDLPFAARFAKYQPITIEAEPHRTDQRPETLRPVSHDISLGEKIDTKRAWQRRRELVEPLMVDSMCGLMARERTDRTSLGVFRPTDIAEFVWEREEEAWSQKQRLVADQLSLTIPQKQSLEKLPYRFRFHYRCAAPACPGHKQSIIDWELGESYRSWLRLYGEEDTLRRLRVRWLEEMCGPSKDTAFFVGNQHLHRQSFLVLGVFWPPLSAPTAA